MNRHIARTSRLDRQSFLGATSPDRLSKTRAAIVGLGGGGSHINQQLAYLGLGNFFLFDPDKVEDTNLNRLVGATEEDVLKKTSKVLVAERLIRAVNPLAHIAAYKEQWQSHPEELTSSDIIFGCVDSIIQRNELESAARRHLIPYIDIGMDVTSSDNGFSIGGQIAISMPGGPCLQCMGIVTQQRLKEEAGQYGAAGGRPQVIWPNGVLASAAVSMFVKLTTPWEIKPKFPVLIEYDGDMQALAPSNKLAHLEIKHCKHFEGLSQIGNPFWKTSRSTT